ncbi:MAG: peptidylprolyl isomerase [Alphaproteobacteria bacterium]|nr:MAG: peptidylprolyl isomerase [Alphaproteobacteria bacterium]
MAERRAPLAAALALALTAVLGAGSGAAAGGRCLGIELGGRVSGEVVVRLRDDLAPRAAQRLEQLAAAGAYDRVAFHRAIAGFMVQTGDVRFGRVDGDLSRAGFGGSDLPDLPLEPSDVPFAPGVVGMARAADPDSANSQFFIMLGRAPHLDGAYTVVGEVIEGMDLVRRIRTGPASANGRVRDPDWMERVRPRPCPEG